MSEKDAVQGEHTTDIKTIPSSQNTEHPNANIEAAKPLIEHPKTVEKKQKKTKKEKKKFSCQGFVDFLYNPRNKTVLGRSALNWTKLAGFYTIFYFCLGCFFVGLLSVFYLLLDKHEPRYYDTESTMAVRTTATVVGMGFRPQPFVDDNRIQITEKMASSLRLYRDVYLLQKPDAKTDDCSDDTPASALPPGTACRFDWSHIVNSPSHPCSDSNLFGFKNEEPCVLVKLNKVYGWTPMLGHLPRNIQELRGLPDDKPVTDSDVYVTCAGSNAADNDVLQDITYYSIETLTGSSKFGIIPQYFFPYRNAPGHVQPFVLVQFKNLPLNRLISVTCRAWAPGIEHDTRGMRGMVTFQLYRSNSNN